MRKFVILLLALCCLTTACNRAVPSETVAVPTVPADAPTTEATQAPTEAPQTDAPTVPDALTVVPLPVTIDINALDNCTVAVSLEQGGANYGSDDTRIPTMTVTVYTYELFDMVDISLLKTGDTILLRGEDVRIESLERKENGAVVINGGLDMGGYELWTDESTVYFETGYSDAKNWYELGTVCLEVSKDFVFTDYSDLDKGPITYTFDDLVSEHETLIYAFGPQSTTVTIENGVIIFMERLYTP